MPDRLLGDVGEHRVGAAEGHHRHLREEQRDLPEHVAGAEQADDRGDRQQPERAPDCRRPERARGGLARLRQRRVAEEIRPGLRRPGRAVAAADPELRQAGAAAEIAGEAGCQHDRRERQVEQEQRDERGRRQRHHRRALQGAPADAQHRLGDDGQHRRLEPEEQAGDHADIARQRVDPAQRHDRDEAGQDEQAARDQPAAGAVHQPADIGGELLRLRPRQQRAEVQGVQEAVFGDPAPLLDEDAVHHRDLPGRPAEGQGGDAAPDGDRLGQARHAQTERRGVGHRDVGAVRHVGFRLPCARRGRAVRGVRRPRGRPAPCRCGARPCRPPRSASRRPRRRRPPRGCGRARRSRSRPAS